MLNFIKKIKRGILELLLSQLQYIDNALNATDVVLKLLIIFINSFIEFNTKNYHFKNEMLTKG